MSSGLELAHAVHYINDAGDESENSRDSDNENERKKMQLQHDPTDRAHLANGCNFSGPDRFHPHFIADEIVQDPSADQDYRVPRDDKNREPRRKSAVVGIDFAPIANAQGDDAAEQQSLVGN